MPLAAECTLPDEFVGHERVLQSFFLMMFDSAVGNDDCLYLTK